MENKINMAEKISESFAMIGEHQVIRQQVKEKFRQLKSIKKQERDLQEQKDEIRREIESLSERASEITDWLLLKEYESLTGEYSQ